MDLVTIKQFAEEQGISYEAVRRQVVRYSKELSGHVIKQDRTQFLDEEAVTFLKERRRESPIILMNMDQNEEIENLRAQVEGLKAQLMSAQNELLRSQEERLKAQDRIIELQDEAKKTLEDRTRYSALLEDNKAKEEKLKEAETREEELKREVDEKDRQIAKARREAEDQKAEDQKTIDELQRERDDAQAEAQSFTRSIFGFYRKR